MFSNKDILQISCLLDLLFGMANGAANDLPIAVPTLILVESDEELACLDIRGASFLWQSQASLA